LIKVFVAEDEPLLLRTVKNMIEQTHSSFKVIGEALNGKLALSAIESLKPDVLFTDIKMPVMDGLTLVNKLNGLYSDITTVVLSGYQEFEYARKALQLGVSDYLLKPLSPSALKALLDKIYDDFQNRMNEKQLEVLRKVIVDYISYKEIERDNLHELFTSEEFYSILLCSGSFCTYSCSWLTPGREFWMKNNIAGIVSRNTIGNNHFWVLDGERGNEKIIIMGIEDSTLQDVSCTMKSIHSALDALGFPITTVIGHIGNNICNAGKVVQESRITLNKNIRFARSSFIFENNSERTQNEDINITDMNTEKTLNILIKNNQSERLKQEIGKLLEICEEKSFRQINLERFIKYILNLFYISLGSMSDSRTTEIDMETNELLSNSATYKSISEGLSTIIDELFRTQKSKIDNENSQKDLVDKIEQYIKSNFCTEITLQTLSDIFCMVPPYLSRVFKRVKGISPNDYIINLRIEKSKELLMMDPPAILSDIAETVGFNDRYYFSKVFKSVTGKTPSEFRLDK
jgi:Response regulator containing CheY-like receiver domain and AraC-type DNA-binding domain